MLMTFQLEVRFDDQLNLLCSTEFWTVGSKLPTYGLGNKIFRKIKIKHDKMKYNLKNVSFKNTKAVVQRYGTIRKK